MKSDLPERIFQFAVEIVKLCRMLDEKPGASRTLANQLLRAGLRLGRMWKKVKPVKAKRILLPSIAL